MKICEKEEDRGGIGDKCEHIVIHEAPSIEGYTDTPLSPKLFISLLQRHLHN